MTASSRLRTLRAVLAIVVAQSAYAQVPDTIYPGPVMGGEFGTTLGVLGDVDGDGVPDFVVGSPREDTAAGTDAGRVRVISGQTGAVLHTFEGDGPNDTFGTTVANAGDVDGDGITDVMGGATEVYPVSSPGPGYAKVFSGSTGALIHQLFGTAPGSLFGGTLGSVGDCNGDGRADFFVCANSITRVFSGLTGAPMFAFAGSKADAGRDVTGDGIPDLVSATGSSGVSSVIRVYSCTTGALLRQQSVPAKFTPRVTLIDDVDFDGRADIIVSDTKSSLGGVVNCGVVQVLSGVDGATIFVIAGAQYEYLGWATAAIGDIDGDGVEDFATATAWSFFQASPLRVQVMSGATGAVLQTLFEPAPNSAFGWSLGGADMTGDATPDLLVGVVGDAPNGYASGSVFRYDSPTPAYDVVYRSAGCGGALPDPPVMKLLIQPTTSWATMLYSAGPPLGTVALVLGAPLVPPAQVFPSGCRLSIDASQPYLVFAIVPLDVTGAASLGAPLPTNLGGTGITMDMQSLVASPAGALALTQALSLTFN